MANDLSSFMWHPTSALLLDLENFGLLENFENLVEEKAQYPLATKIAVANFTAQQKLSKILHDKMYSMIHVPKFTNSADAQMIVTGCLLFINSPQVKEVFIGSNDAIFSPLQKTLIHLGKKAHIVTRKGNQLFINEKVVKSVDISNSTEINHINDLIKAINTVVVNCLKKQKISAIKLNTLCNEFSRIHGKGINHFLKMLKEKKKLVNLIKSIPGLNLIKKKQEYYISLAKSSK